MATMPPSSRPLPSNIPEQPTISIFDSTDEDVEELSGPEYGNTRHLFGAADALYSIETDGTLYKIDLD